MKSGVLVTKDIGKNILASLHRLVQNEVLVGIPEEKGVRYADTTAVQKTALKKSSAKGKKPNLLGGIDPNITNAEIGYIQNFGSPEMNIPAREFMYSGIRSVQAKINQYLGQAGKAALAGKQAVSDRALHAAGITAMNGVRNKIQSGPFQELAPATLAARRRRGRTGEKPLLDTAQLRNSVTYVVRRSLVSGKR